MNLNIKTKFEKTQTSIRKILKRLSVLEHLTMFCNYSTGIFLHLWQFPLPNACNVGVLAGMFLSQCCDPIVYIIRHLQQIFFTTTIIHIKNVWLSAVRGVRTRDAPDTVFAGYLAGRISGLFKSRIPDIRSRIPDIRTDIWTNNYISSKISATKIMNKL
jgi:hypothetical protein